MLHSDKKLTLVFEYCDQDLKKYFDSCNGEIDPDTVKVSRVFNFCYLSLIVRKLVFGVSDQVPHKPVYTATEDG